MARAVTVRVLGQCSNRVTVGTWSAAVAIGANAGGGTLSGTTTVAASGGIATFSTLSIDKTGTGYTLAATDGSLGAGTSGTFNITSAERRVGKVGGEPSAAGPGEPITPAGAARV